jgi:hydroxymethylbilane synthase
MVREMANCQGRINLFILGISFMSDYRIGTRGSLLAVAQSSLIKKKLEEISGKTFEIVTIKTQGDKITNVPLWQLEGKDFFTKELDEALIENKVDLVIHSYKDLGSDRPDDIELAAVTERTFPHDVLLMKKSWKKKLLDKKTTLTIGTSSPRRLENLKILGDFLPGENHQIEFKMLRGNVNTRIKKLIDDEFDGIILALAGLERLATFDDSRKVLTSLCQDLTFMILPLSLFPTAAAQGALAIEINQNRTDENALLKIIAKLNHDKTFDEVKLEKKYFKEYGGGCHLAVGITVQKTKDHLIEFHRGKIDETHVLKKRISHSSSEKKKLDDDLFIFLGMGKQRNSFNILKDTHFKKEILSFQLPQTIHHLYITGRWPIENSTSFKDHFVWSAGLMTWKKLAQKGEWIHGTSDGLGEDFILKIKSSFWLTLFSPELNWMVLSHQNAHSSIGPIIPCYQHVPQEMSVNDKEHFKKIKYCLWASAPQFEFYTTQVPSLLKAMHFCGPGKTYDELMKKNIPLNLIIDTDDFFNRFKE